MGWTKQQLVDEALAELAISDGQGFEITPDEEQRALRRMDAMLAIWANKGVRIGYAFPGDLDADSGVPDAAAQPIFLNLARELAPGFGKQLSAETLKNAREGYDMLLWNAARPPEQQLPHTMARGQGNKPWRTVNRAFLPRPDDDPLQSNDQNGDLTILQE